jgi:flagellar hook-length control protein FliK
VLYTPQTPLDEADVVADDGQEDTPQQQNRQATNSPIPTPARPVAANDPRLEQLLSAPRDHPLAPEPPAQPEITSAEIPKTKPLPLTTLTESKAEPADVPQTAPEVNKGSDPVLTPHPMPAVQPVGTDHAEVPNVKQQPIVHTPAQVDAPAPIRPEHEFASANHDRIVSSVRSELIPGGGTMRIRLDPPQLGELQVTVHMIDGVMTASFETSTDHATRLLSHNLGQLKQALETQGISVDKLHVQQSSRDQPSDSKNDEQQQRQSQQSNSEARHEQQRREMLRRLWRRLGVGHDFLDMVA